MCSHQASLQQDLLGGPRAEAIGVEGQRVLKVGVHSPHDVGAELQAEELLARGSRGSVPQAS